MQCPEPSNHTIRLFTSELSGSNKWILHTNLNAKIFRMWFVIFLKICCTDWNIWINYLRWMQIKYWMMSMSKVIINGCHAWLFIDIQFSLQSGLASLLDIPSQCWWDRVDWVQHYLTTGHWIQANISTRHWLTRNFPAFWLGKLNFENTGSVSASSVRWWAVREVWCDTTDWCKMKLLTVCSFLLVILTSLGTGVEAGTEETNALLYLSKYGYISNNDGKFPETIARLVYCYKVC